MEIVIDFDNPQYSTSDPRRNEVTIHFIGTLFSGGTEQLSEV